MATRTSFQPRIRARGESGFTLIELIIVVGLLVGVLAIAYGMIVDCMEADRTIERLTLPEKVGEGILTMVRCDLAGTVYRKLGRRIFSVVDNGIPPDARDELRFLSTVEPTPIEEAGAAGTISVTELRGIIGVAYFLRPSQLPENVPAFTLFRKEILDLDPENPLDGRGRAYELYDKVVYFNVDCYDGWGWYSDWDSEARIREREASLAQEQAAGAGRIARVSDTRARTPGTITTPGVAPADEEEREVLPPAGIPVAVRVELGIYVAPGGKLLRDAHGAPVVKVFTALVPILAAQRLPMEFEEEDLALAGGDLSLSGALGEGASGDVVRGVILGGLPGAGGEGKPQTKRLPGGRGGERLRGSLKGGRLPGGTLPGTLPGARGGPSAIPGGRSAIPGGSTAPGGRPGAGTGGRRR